MNDPTGTENMNMNSRNEMNEWVNLPHLLANFLLLFWLDKLDKIILNQKLRTFVAEEELNELLQVAFVIVHQFAVVEVRHTHVFGVSSDVQDLELRNL